ncbi:MAG: Fic family protein [Ignavibacteria bacterium]|nr:Fic family protein [Ignavibacteria bacterium]
MDIDKFKAGNFQSGYKYKFFVPEKINHTWNLNNSALSVQLEKASLKLGELNSFARFIPDINRFIHLHVTKEAVVSSKIEGTQTGMNEALLSLEDILPERRDDWREVNNYTNALNYCIEKINELPVSTPLFKQAHKILMDGVRGENKQPGEYRYSQNWIGGSSISEATFIPPADNLINDLMGDLENFLHNEKIQVPHLIRIGLAHYQFETIHPFLDGNGRIGRLLITLYLVDKKLLDKPLLYLSKYFEKSRNTYYDKLTRVRTNNELKEWLIYFLKGIEETSSYAVENLKEIISLKEKIEADFNTNWNRRSHTAHRLLNSLFIHPVVKIKDVEEYCSLTAKSAGDLVEKFVNAGYLREITRNPRGKIFIFEPYLDLFNG